MSRHGHAWTTSTACWRAFSLPGYYRLPAKALLQWFCSAFIEPNKTTAARPSHVGENNQEVKMLASRLLKSSMHDRVDYCYTRRSDIGNAQSVVIPTILGNWRSVDSPIEHLNRRDDGNYSVTTSSHPAGFWCGLLNACSVDNKFAGIQHWIDAKLSVTAIVQTSHDDASSRGVAKIGCRGESCWIKTFWYQLCKRDGSWKLAVPPTQEKFFGLFILKRCILVRSERLLLTMHSTYEHEYWCCSFLKPTVEEKRDG